MLFGECPGGMAIIWPTVLGSMATTPLWALILAQMMKTILNIGFASRKNLFIWCPVTLRKPPRFNLNQKRHVYFCACGAWFIAERRQNFPARWKWAEEHQACLQQCRTCLRFRAQWRDGDALSCCLAAALTEQYEQHDLWTMQALVDRHG